MHAVNLDPNDPQVRTAVFGQQVQEFLRSEIGHFLIQRAEKELGEAIEKLKTANPRDAENIVRLQVQVALLEKFESWLGDAVQDGLTAIANIDGEEDNAQD